MRAHTPTHAHVHAHTHTRTRACAHTYTHMHTNACAHIYTHTAARTHTYADGITISMSGKILGCRDMIAVFRMTLAHSSTIGGETDHNTHMHVHVPPCPSLAPPNACTHTHRHAGRQAHLCAHQPHHHRQQCWVRGGVLQANDGEPPEQVTRVLLQHLRHSTQWPWGKGRPFLERQLAMAQTTGRAA